MAKGRNKIPAYTIPWQTFSHTHTHACTHTHTHTQEHLYTYIWQGICSNTRAEQWVCWAGRGSRVAGVHLEGLSCLPWTALSHLDPQMASLLLPASHTHARFKRLREREQRTFLTGINGALICRPVLSCWTIAGRESLGKIVILAVIWAKAYLLTTNLTSLPQCRTWLTHTAFMLIYHSAPKQPIAKLILKRISGIIFCNGESKALFLCHKNPLMHFGYVDVILCGHLNNPNRICP